MGDRIDFSIEFTRHHSVTTRAIVDTTGRGLAARLEFFDQLGAVLKKSSAIFGAITVGKMTALHAETPHWSAVGSDAVKKLQCGC